MANNSDVIIGWVGFSLALVIGYGAYKNKPAFGPNGIVTTAVRTGKIGNGSGPKVPNHSVYVPGRGIVDPAPSPGWSQTTAFVQAPSPTSLQAPPAPSASGGSGGGLLSEIGSLLKGLFGGAPATSPQGGTVYV